MRILTLHEFIDAFKSCVKVDDMGIVFNAFEINILRQDGALFTEVCSKYFMENFRKYHDYFFEDSYKKYKEFIKEDTERASDILFTAISQGKTACNQLASSMGSSIKGGGPMKLLTVNEFMDALESTISTDSPTQGGVPMKNFRVRVYFHFDEPGYQKVFKIKSDCSENAELKAKNLALADIIEQCKDSYEILGTEEVKDEDYI